MKKFMGAALVYFVIILLSVVCAFAEETASVVFSGTDAVCTNASVASTNATADDLYNGGGRQGWILNPNKDLSSIVVNIDNAFMNKLSGGQTVDATVWYLDSGNGQFALLYDAEDNSQYWADSVALTNTGEWKSHTFHLDEAYFADRLSGGDIMLVSSHKFINNTADIIVGEIIVEGSAHINPVEISVASSKTGNIFFGNSVPVFDIGYNKKDENSGGYSARVYVRDENENVIYDEQSTILAETSEQTQIIKLTDIDFGVYTLCVEVYDSLDENVYSRCEKKFSRVNTDFANTLNDKFGYSLHLTVPYLGYNREKSKELIANSGAGQLRDSFVWSEYWTSNNGFVVKDLWSNILSDANTAGQEYMLILGYHDKWDYPNQENDLYITTEKSLAQFKEYITALVNEVGDDVTYFEIWNEYNIQNPDVQAYFNLLKLSYETITSIKPDAKVIGGALANTYSEEEGRYIVPYDYITELFDMGAGEYMDILSIHPYTILGSPESKGIKQICDKTRELVQQYAPDMEVWASEYGWYTKTGFCSEAQQAEYGVRTLIMNQAYGFVDKFLWYTFQDESINPYDIEHSWGMIYSPEDNYDGQKNPYAAKSSYVATANANKLLAKAVLDTDMSDTDAGRYVYKFKDRFGKTVYAMWNINGNENYNITTDENLMLVDFYGNEKHLYEAGSIEVSISERPVYLCGVADGTAYEEGGTLKIEGYVPSGEKDVNVGVTVLYPYEDFGNISENPINSIMYVDQQKSSEGGVYSFDIAPNLKAGEYTAVVASVDSETVYEYKFILLDKLYAEYDEQVDGNELDIMVTVNNPSEKSYDEVFAILALYNDDGLDKCECLNSSILNEEMNKEFNFNINLNENYKEARIFIWDDMLRPLVMTYNLNKIK